VILFLAGIPYFTATISELGIPVKSGCWAKIWVNILKDNLKYLDLSSVDFDGSNTPCKNGADAVGYQGRKSCKTTNSLFVYDNQGVMMTMSTPQEGQHRSGS
jgi:hypothetical protein